MMIIECPRCKAALEPKDKRCRYCRTPITTNANDIPQAEFTDTDREAFLKGREANAGCLIYILLPIAVAGCLWLVF